jgi:hypothetical protein
MLICPSISASTVLSDEVELVNGFFTASFSFSVVLLCSGAPTSVVEFSVRGGEMGSVWLLVSCLVQRVMIGGVEWEEWDYVPWNCASMLDLIELALAGPGSSATGGSTMY